MKYIMTKSLSENGYDDDHCTCYVVHRRRQGMGRCRCSLLAVVTADVQRLAEGINTDRFCWTPDQIISANAEPNEYDSIGRRKRKTGMSDLGSNNGSHQSGFIHFHIRKAVYSFFRMLNKSLPDRENSGGTELRRVNLLPA